MSRTLRDQLIQHEGIRLSPYRDTVGKLTIGVGRNLDDMGITRDEALFLLDNDILRAQSAVIHALPWSTTLDRPRFEVLVNMAFNLGINGLLGFAKFLAALQAGDYPTAAQEMLDSRWATQVGQRALELATIVDPSGNSGSGIGGKET